MEHTVDVWLDFRSSYAWFASQRIARGGLPLPAGVAWCWRPVSINVLLNLQAGREPLATCTDSLAPTKREYVFDKVQHCRQSYGMDLEVPEPVRPETKPALAAFSLPATEPVLQASLFSAIFKAIWQEKQDVGQRETLGAIATQLHIESTVIDRACSEPARDELVTTSVEASENADVFGVPTFVWPGERYFGVDRLDMADVAIQGEKEWKATTLPG